MDPGLPSLRSARQRLARRPSPAKFFSPAINFTLLEDGACIQGASAVRLGTQANFRFTYNCLRYMLSGDSISNMMMMMMLVVYF